MGLIPIGDDKHQGGPPALVTWAFIALLEHPGDVDVPPRRLDAPLGNMLYLWIFGVLFYMLCGMAAGLAHIGGFVAGLALVKLFARRPARPAPA